MLLLKDTIQYINFTLKKKTQKVYILLELLDCSEHTQFLLIFHGREPVTQLLQSAWER